MEKVRMSLLLTQELDQEIQDIADKRGWNKSDVIRNALVLYTHALDAKKNNMRVGFSKSPDGLDQEVIGIF